MQVSKCSRFNSLIACHSLHSFDGLTRHKQFAGAATTAFNSQGDRSATAVTTGAPTTVHNFLFDSNNINNSKIARHANSFFGLFYCFDPILIIQSNIAKVTNYLFIPASFSRGGIHRRHNGYCPRRERSNPPSLFYRPFFSGLYFFSSISTCIFFLATFFNPTDGIFIHFTYFTAQF